MKLKLKLKLENGQNGRFKVLFKGHTSCEIFSLQLDLGKVCKIVKLKVNKWMMKRWKRWKSWKAFLV